MNSSRKFSNLVAAIALPIAILLSGISASAQKLEASEGVLLTGRGEAGKPAIVLAHDWFGDTPYYREFASRLVEQGYTVIASDLYKGNPGASDHAGAWERLQKLTKEHAAAVLDRNIELAASQSEKVIIIGFSAGAPHAFDAASRNGDIVDASVVFYSTVATDEDTLSNLGGPVLAIYGSKDGLHGKLSAAETAAQLSEAADAAGAAAEIHIYPGAAHAFAQPLFNAGKTYDPVAANSAWNVTLDFISRIEETE